ncbi:hypothetical protein Ancab_039956 [Ancistrocladus abbreviatus]
MHNILSLYYIGIAGISKRNSVTKQKFETSRYLLTNFKITQLSKGKGRPRQMGGDRQCSSSERQRTVADSGGDLVSDFGAVAVGLGGCLWLQEKEICSSWWTTQSAMTGSRLRHPRRHIVAVLNLGFGS